MEHTRAGVVEVLVQELLRRLLAFSDPACRSCTMSGIQGRLRHTSLAALAMSEKAAGADIVNYLVSRRGRLRIGELKRRRGEKRLEEQRVNGEVMF